LPTYTLQQKKAELLRRKLATESLMDFCRFTKADYKPGPHHKLIVDALQQVEAGAISRLMIFLPPRHGKSELVSRKFPAWFIGRNSDRQIISASYNSDLATEFGRDVRNTIADTLYRQLFPVELRQDSKAADRWVTDNGGSYLAAGVGSGITGRGAHLGIIDDPFKDRKEAESKTVREGVWNWYTSTFYTRLMPGASIILCQTRWNEDDLAGRLLRVMAKGGEQWTVINLPALAEGPDLLGRLEGEALWPAWYPKETLLQIQNTIGTYDWLSLYQQRPTSEKGNIFKRTWWRLYREVPDFDLKIQSWDTAFKDGEENDYSVCTTWGALNEAHGSSLPGFYLIDRYKERMPYPELKRVAITEAVRHSPDLVLIEDKASGQSLMQDLQRESNLPLKAISVDRDKIARAHAVTSLIEGGRVYVPEWAQWIDDYLAEMAAFPKGAHDDDVDSTTQALNYLRDNAGLGGGMTTEYVQQLMDEQRPIL
jgi:predicted phage terminase large subunit-like protein